MNIYRQKGLVSRADRERLKDHRSIALWFTGLSGSGKSTIAHVVEKRLFDSKVAAYVLDGDNIRYGLCNDLAFSEQDRSENNRRISEITKLFLDAGIIVLTAFISPYRKDRENARKIIGPNDFIEIYCKCPIEVCEERDVKGLYAKARKGLIKNYTGISDPYEEPISPDIILETSKTSIALCAERVLEALEKRTRDRKPVLQVN